MTDPERDALEAAYLDYLKDLFKTLTSNIATHAADPDREDPMHQCMRGVVAARAALQAFKDALA